MGFFGGGGGGTTPVNMVGASTGTAGTAGYVPAPAAGKNTRYLSSDATFGELPLVPQYKTANTSVIRNYMSGQTGTGFAPVIKVRYFAIVYCPASGSIDTLEYMTSTAPTSTFNVNVSMWECAEDGRPSTYVTGVNIASGTGGFSIRSASITPITISRGFYWMSLTAEATGSATSIRFDGAKTAYASFLGLAQLDGNVNGLQYTCLTSYDQQTHETFSLTTSGNIPLVGFEYA